MATSYKLSYTASEIDEKLGKVDEIDTLSTQITEKADAEHTHTVVDIMDLTATATELNYMDGVTSNVQTQLDALTSTVAGKAASSHTHTASEVSADASGTAASLVETHNTATDAHADIREEISQLSSQKAALLLQASGMEEKLDIFFAVNKITEVEYA